MREQIAVHTIRKMYWIRLDRIVAFQAREKFTIAHTRDGVEHWLSNEPIVNLRQECAPDFVSPHRAWLVRALEVAALDWVNSWASGELTMDTGLKVPVARRQLAAVRTAVARAKNSRRIEGLSI